MANAHGRSPQLVESVEAAASQRRVAQGCVGTSRDPAVYSAVPVQEEHVVSVQSQAAPPAAW